MLNYLNNATYINCFLRQTLLTDCQILTGWYGVFCGPHHSTHIVQPSLQLTKCLHTVWLFLLQQPPRPTCPWSTSCAGISHFFNINPDDRHTHPDMDFYRQSHYKLHNQRYQHQLFPFTVYRLQYRFTAFSNDIPASQHQHQPN